MNQRIKTRKETQERHKQLRPYTRIAKLDYDKLPKRVLEHLKRLFVEAKWLRNAILNTPRFSDYDTKQKTVEVKVQDHEEQRELKVLSSQMKQGVRTKLIQDCVKLKRAKEKGYKVGRLKHKPFCNSIPLKQYKVTFKIDKQKQRMRLQGLKGTFRIRGLDQLKGEIGSAELIRKPSGFYIHITTWDRPKKKTENKCSIGIDGGCDKPLTLSNGIQVDNKLPIPTKVRKLDRKIQKGNRPRSNNKLKDQRRRRLLYENLTNRKRDMRNQVVSVLRSRFEYLFVQDENIKAWHKGGHGKSVQNSALGRIYKDLKSLTPTVVSKHFPSTQLCPTCGRKNKLPLSERVYTCNCGFRDHRDLKSARCIEMEGLRLSGTEYTEVKLGENSTSAEMEAIVDRFRLIPHLRVSKLNSLSQEASAFRRG